MNEHYIKNDNGGWLHRPPIKRIINPILRFLQFFSSSPYVIASITELGNETPKFIKFVFRRVKINERKK